MFGSYSAAQDAEAISVATTLLEQLGVKNVELRLNSLGCVECRNHYNQKLKEFIASHLDKLCDTCKQRYLKNPLRDGDVERPDDESYTGHYFLNANCKTKPGVIDRYKKPIVDTTEFYSGCYGYASVSFYAFHSAGNKGIACGLNNLMKTREGENLGGRARAEDDFADINIDDNVEEGFYTVDENDDYIF